MFVKQWCIMYSAMILLASSNLLTDDVKSLIYTYQTKYCGRSFCSSDSSFQSQICPRVIPGQTLGNTSIPLQDKVQSTVETDVHINNTSTCDPCNQCSCHESCVFFGTCCADKYIGGKYFVNCEMIKRFHDGAVDEDMYMIVTKCLPDAPYYNQDLADKCEHGELGYIQDGRLVTAPHPYNTSVTFRNKYCASCYGVANYTYWNVYISCHKDVDASNYPDINSFIRFAKDHFCEISFQLPQDVMPSPCFPPQNIMISTCNVTGKWRESNDSITNACENYYNPTRDWKYKNIFCYLCNGNTEEDLICYSDCFFGTIKPVYPRPFIALLNFENSDAVIIKSEKNSNFKIKRIGKQEDHQCRNGDKYDALSEICREVYCPLAGGHVNSTCVRLVDSQQHVMTLWNVTAYYGIDITVQLMMMRPFGKSVLTSIVSMVKDFGFIVANGTANGIAHITSPSTMSVAECQVELNLFLLSSFNLEISRQNLKQEHKLNISLDGVEMNITVVTGHRDNMKNKLKLRGTVFQSFVPEMKTVDISKTFKVPLAFNVSCSMVRFTDKEVVAVNDSFIIHGNYVLDEEDYFSTIHGDYYICVDALKREKDIILESFPVSNTMQHLPGTVITIVSLSCSLFFLLITMLVYIFIKELHTIPGLNLIFLTSSLFAAQILFLLGGGTVTTPTICAVIGILIHYFWLVAFAWMNVCCLHMFQVFTNTFKSLHFSNDKMCLIVRYSVFSYGVAILIVASTIMTTYVRSDYTSIPYGGTTICFVAPGLVSIISFGVPVGLTIFITAILLIMAILHMSRVKRTNPQIPRIDENDISKFFKLSTLTGLSWMFGFLGYFLKRDELLYTFTILSGGHGVFIFLSFVASRRILNMVRRCFRRPQ